MTGRGSHEESWDDIATSEDVMAATGETNHLVVGLSNCAPPSDSGWTRCLEDVPLLRVIAVDKVCEDAARSGGGQDDYCAALSETYAKLSSFARGGTNEQLSSEFRERNLCIRSASIVGSGRHVHLQTRSSHPLWPTDSRLSSDVWRLFKGDYCGPSDGTQRIHLSTSFDLKKPAFTGNAVCEDFNTVPEQMSGEVFLSGEEHVLDCSHLSGGPLCLFSADRRGAVLSTESMATQFYSSTSADAFIEGVNILPIWELSESRQLLQATAEVEGCEAEVVNTNHPQRGLRSMLRCPENLHYKRAKFLPLPTWRTFTSASSRGSYPSSSSRPGSCSGLNQGSQLPGLVHLHLPSKVDEQEPMDSGNAGGEESGDGERQITSGDMEDDEIQMDLTDDLLHKVFSFLDDNGLCRAAMVCKQWRVASAHEDFWKILNFEGRHVTHEQVGLLCVRYPNATALNLRGATCVDEVLVREAMRTLRNLEVLTLGHGFWSDGFFHALAIECSSLQNLSITDATLGSGGAQEIQLRHESLCRLQINKCRVLRIAIRCPQLDWLSLKRTGTASAVLHCPRLVSLDVSSCHKLSDVGVRAAATACPLLASLDVSNCAYISDETLREISLICPNLRVLDASYCPNISLEVVSWACGMRLWPPNPQEKGQREREFESVTSGSPRVRHGQLSWCQLSLCAGVRMPVLTELKLVGCEGIISSSMAALSTCVMLEDLAMDFCWLLTAVTLDLPRLFQISLTNNRKIVELNLRSPALTKLNLVSCPILNRVDITSNSLQSLVLRQQNGLSSMSLQCIWLLEVDLSECEALTDAVCDVFSDEGGCPKLKSLILDSCEGLHHVKLASSSVQSLSLMGCRNMASLNLSCPGLQHIQLDGCDHLMEASFAPVGLQYLNLGICPHLVKLTVEASQMGSLDLRGCGVLTRAAIHCPSLLSLDASYCSQLRDDCLDETTSACPSIQSLVLASCPSVGPVGLLSLKRLKDLTTLDLSYTFLTDLSPIFEACPGLKVLRLSACKYLGNTALDALHGGKVLPKLLELDLSYGSLGHSAIERVMDLCPHLCHVSLNGCAHVTDYLWAQLSSLPVATFCAAQVSGVEERGMEDSALSSRLNTCQGVQRVYSIDAATARDSYCSRGPASISDRQLVFPKEREQAHLYSITAVVSQLPASDGVIPCLGSEIMGGTPLQSEIFVDTNVGTVRSLQNLSCVGCPHIKKVIIPRFAACFHLSSLNLSLSVNIEEVQLSCPNLASLNLSNCTGLVVLELNCPRLMSLFLQACGIEAEVLELAIQGCHFLETLDVRGCSKVSSAALARMRSLCPGLKRLYSTTTA